MHDYVVVDSFTRRPLDGNPVAVFFDCEDLTTHLMQRIANEMHLSETTFVLPPQCWRRRSHPHLHSGQRAAVRRAPHARNRCGAR